MGLVNSERIYKFIAILCLDVEYQYQTNRSSKAKTLQERGPVNFVG